jgi:hypothetical protein
MDTDKNLVATFTLIPPVIPPPPIGYDLRVLKRGDGDGIVTATGSVVLGGITIPVSPLLDCGLGRTGCRQSFWEGSNLTLSGSPASDSVFTAWGEDCSSAGAVTMNGNKTCIATFTLIPPIIVPPPPGCPPACPGGGGPSVTANLTVRKIDDPGPFSDGPLSIDPTDQIELRWSSTANPDLCIGTNFGTNNQTNGTQQTITEPTAGNSITYTIDCYKGPSRGSDSVTVTTTGSGGAPTISANPPVVDYGGTSTVTANPNGNSGCTVGGSNGDTLGTSGALTSTLVRATVSLVGETTYTISCPSLTPVSTKIRVRPQFQEI